MEKYKLVLETDSFERVLKNEGVSMSKGWYAISILLCLFLTAACNKKAKDSSAESLDVNVDTTIALFKVDLTISEDPVHQEKAADIRKMVELLHKRKQFNGTILVAEKGKVILLDSYGKATFKPSTELTDSTSFHLASVSKQFTAMAIMMLEEKGKLNYDDPVVKYIPELPYTDITVKQLLQHTSGLPKITDYIPRYLSFWDSCKIALNEDIPIILRDYQPGIQFYPGRRFSYNNTGYILLANVIEKVSGKSYEEYLYEKIFKPLSMKQTFVYNIANINSCPPKASGYAIYRRTYVPDEDDIRNGLVGEKGIYSSAIDLFKWDQALYTEKLVKKETLEKAFSRGKLVNGKEIDYGFGWRMPRKESNLVYHFGQWRGFRTGIIRILNDEYTIIILNNTGSRRLKYMVLKTIDILYRDRKGKPDF